jgi:hypothetical protein
MHGNSNVPACFLGNPWSTGPADEEKPEKAIVKICLIQAIKSPQDVEICLCGPLRGGSRIDRPQVIFDILPQNAKSQDSEKRGLHTKFPS